MGAGDKFDGNLCPLWRRSEKTARTCATGMRNGMDCNDKDYF